MTTKTVDNIISKSIQEIANEYVAYKYDYVEPRENPIALREKNDSVTQDARDSANPELLFGQTHNDIECALCPTAKRPCDRAWFSAKQVENWSEMSTMTLWRWLKRLENARRISTLSDMIKWQMPHDQGGSTPTTLYNLNVLNQLAMACIDNEKLNEVSCKFSDMLSEKEAEMILGSQAQPQSQATLPDFMNPAEAARAWATEYEQRVAAEKALSAQVEENKALEVERNEAVRTKTQYQSNLAAQMSGRVGGLTTALNRVKLENSRLKGDRLTKEDVYIIMNTQGVSFTLKTVKDVIRDTLNVISEYLDEPFPKIKVGEHTNGDGKVVDVQAYVYTRKTVRAFFEYVENNPLGWQARNRKFILSEWLNHHMTIPADQDA